MTRKEGSWMSVPKKAGVFLNRTVSEHGTCFYLKRGFDNELQLLVAIFKVFNILNSSSDILILLLFRQFSEEKCLTLSPCYQIYFIGKQDRQLFA